MKGFASTVILLSIVSLVTAQVNLQNELQSSMFEQKANIQLMQRTNEKIYNIERGFEKTVKESYKEAKMANYALKLTGIDADAGIEPYICAKLMKWSADYNMEVALVDKFEITNIEFTKEDFDSNKLKIAEDQFEKISKNNLEFPSLSCLAVLDSDPVSFDYNDISVEFNVVQVGWTDRVNLNVIKETKKSIMRRLLTNPVPPSFVFEDEILGQKITVVIPGGTEI